MCRVCLRAECLGKPRPLCPGVRPWQGVESGRPLQTGHSREAAGTAGPPLLRSHPAGLQAPLLQASAWPSQRYRKLAPAHRLQAHLSVSSNSTVRGRLPVTSGMLPPHFTTASYLRFFSRASLDTDSCG